MDNTKLTVLLKSLSKTEVERFSMFLKTPLFNERETLSNLFDEIRNFYPEFSDPAFTKENLFKKLYNDRPYNDELMRNMISRLHKLSESFLSLLNYQKDGFYKQLGLLTEMNNRGLEVLFKKKFEKTRNHFDDTGNMNIETFFNRHQLAIMALSHFFSFAYTPNVDKNLLTDREEKLIDYFLCDILDVYSMMAYDLQTHPENEYKFIMLDCIRNYFDKNDDSLNNNYYNQINYNMTQLLLRQNDKYYFICKKLINDNKTKLSRIDKSKHYTALLGYLQMKIFKGDQNMLRERFELFKECFANEGAYYNDHIKHAELILAVSNSLMLKEFSDAEDFVARYVDEVDEYYRQSTKYYCLGLIDYYKMDYDGALKNLTKVDYDDISFKLMVRTLSLMTYFSMNDHEGFYALADSYRHFLDVNKKVSAYNYKVTSNFINFTVKLFRGKEVPDRFDIYGFKRELISTNHIIKKHWLLEQVNEIEKAASQH